MIILSTLGLFSVASALPGAIFERGAYARDNTTCPLGTCYYNCYSYDGCYDHDPCGSPPTNSTCQAGTVGTSTGRQMYVVLPSVPSYNSSAVSYFQAETGPVDIDQVGVFTGIPASAKNCTLMWKTGNYEERSFIVEGNGLLTPTQLKGLDSTQPVSWNAVTAATPIKPSLGADMTNWDQQQFRGSTHVAGSVDCAAQISVQFEINKDGAPAGQNAIVYLKQDDKNGWYISYAC